LDRPVADEPDVLLFSYGTLRLPEVQLSTFGRLLDGHDDAVVGYRLGWVTITDPHVVATSGSARHPILVEADEPGAVVEGVVLAITAAELTAADGYEVDDYARVRVPLRSGGQAWAYVPARPDDGPAESGSTV
jgi:Gamma-glutamyl cyclotransferase, AIG2-like